MTLWFLVYEASTTSSQGREEYHFTIKKRKANWIGHILRRNYLLEHITEGKIQGRTEMTARRT